MKKLIMKKSAMKNINGKNKQAGLTILELLVAMTLGAVVLGGALSMQVSHRKGFKSIDNKMNMQTNARFAFEFISNSLREMGSAGCLTANGYVGRSGSALPSFLDLTDNTIYQTSGEYRIGFNNPAQADADFRYQQELIGYDDTTLAGSPPPVALVPASNAGSDVLLVKGAIGPTYVFDSESLYTSNHASLTIDPVRYPFIDLQANQYAVMSQCAGAEIFQITGTDAQVAAGIITHGSGGGASQNANGVFATDDSGAAAGGLTFKRGQSAELRRVASVAYYISNNASGVPTLFRSIDGVANPLVEGVEQMQILFGLDTNGDKAPDTYRDSSTANMSQAVAVRLSFIMRSQDEVYKITKSRTYPIPGEAAYASPSDKFSRQVFTTSVTLRNRLTGNRT